MCLKYVLIQRGSIVYIHPNQYMDMCPQSTLHFGLTAFKSVISGTKHILGIVHKFFGRFEVGAV